jgi:predicted N-acetyltransferase YhbS
MAFRSTAQRWRFVAWWSAGGVPVRFAAAVSKFDADPGNARRTGSGTAALGRCCPASFDANVIDLHRKRMQDSFAITFRFAELDEIEAVRAIEFEAAQRFAGIGMTGIADAQPMKADFVRRKIEMSEIIVAVNEAARCVAFVMFAPLPTRFYIEELDVLTAWAGRRIGAELIEQVNLLARKAGARQLVLSTFRDVPWNAPYYRRLGFDVIESGQLDAKLRAIRAAHVAHGLDESKRVFMCREVEGAPE